MCQDVGSALEAHAQGISISLAVQSIAELLYHALSLHLHLHAQGVV